MKAVIQKVSRKVRALITGAERKGIYNVKGSLWVQRELDYEGFLRVRDVLRGKMGDFGATPKAFAAMIDRWMEEGVLEKLGAVILQPYAPTKMRARRNERAMQAAGITAENVVRSMSVNDLARCVRDFFLLNGRWIESLGLIDYASGLLQRFLQISTANLIPGLLTRLSSSTADKVSQPQTSLRTSQQ